MKIIAFYYPQFHSIPENDEWFGAGFTDWTSVKAARPVFKGHNQPRVPLYNSYYDLLDDETKYWQANTAKKYGIYGFCYHHYWFNGRMLLEKPMEQMLENQEIKIPFCICWANEPWTKTQAGKKTVLIPQTYGDKEEWKAHFEYLLPFFKDSRYIVEDNRPIMIIYRPTVMYCSKEMAACWDILAKEAGFDGIKLMCLADSQQPDDSPVYDAFDNIIEGQPEAAGSAKKGSKVPLLSSLKSIRRRTFAKVGQRSGVDLGQRDSDNTIMDSERQILSYDKVWTDILNMHPTSPKNLPGAFVGWDNTPRLEENGSVIKDETPEKFGKYIEKQIIHAREEYKSDKLFLYAWNDWAEGGYLEPDEEHGYAYLEALREALKNTGEFPERKKKRSSSKKKKEKS